MDKTCRDKINVQVAFSSTSSRIAKATPINIKKHRSFLILFRSKVKRGIYKVAQKNYRLLKPLIRPIARKAKHYFRDAQHQQIQEQMNTQYQQIQQSILSIFRRTAINSDSGAVLVETQVGFVLCSATDHRLLLTLLDSGELEQGTRLLIQKFLRSGDVYVDVGANIGMHVLAAARAMQGQGKIIAFEPFQSTKLMLDQTIQMNGFSIRLLFLMFQVMVHYLQYPIAQGITRFSILTQGVIFHLIQLKCHL
jgi:hypothetical protein